MIVAVMKPVHPATTTGAGSSGAPRLPDGLRLYAIGDIHGRADLLAKLHRLIGADAEAGPKGRRAIVYVGDYVDRGPQSFEVVETLIAGPPPGFEAVHLKGNHEDFLLRFWADGADGELWMMNGGGQTLQSYGIDVAPLDVAPGGLDALHRRFHNALPARHLEFYRTLAMRFEAGDYLFVHAGVRPGVPLESQRDVDLMWIRDEFLYSDEAFGKVVVHGHSIRPEPEVKANRIGIDTGAFATGRLSCLVLEGATRRFLAT